MVSQSTAGYDFPTLSLKGDNWSSIVQGLWKQYLVDILGWTKPQARRRIELEISDDFHQGLLDWLQQVGWSFNESIVADVGCGTGALVAQLVKHHACVIALEPSPTWGYAARMRLNASGDEHQAQILRSNGATLPIKDKSLDYVISLQVLGHVDRSAARQIVCEIARILKQGGRAYVRFENYLSFWEPHYHVKWFPLLPKFIGSIYLRAIGRNPWFLKAHIHYRLGVEVAFWCYQCGLRSLRWSDLGRKIKNPVGVHRWHTRLAARFLNLLPDWLLAASIICYLERGQMFSTTFALEVERV